MKKISTLLLLIGTATTIVAQTKPSADKIMDIVRPYQKTVGKYIDTELCVSMQECVLSENDGTWTTVERTESWKPSETAIVVCDMCGNVRFGEFALALNRVVEEARRMGVTIVRAPSDSGTELGADCRKRGIKNVVLTGIAADICVMAHSFGLRTMKRMDMNVVMMRDMIDVVYNPQNTPFDCLYSDLDAVIEYIEKYVCPTIVSTDFIEAKQSMEKSD
jgi:hypothetical protein